MAPLLFALLLLVCGARAATPRGPFKDADQRLTLGELAAHHGYVAARHTIQTEDGFLLDAWKMSPKDRPPVNQKIVVFLAGWTCEARIFLTGTNGSNSIPYAIADAGHIVWFFNHRNKPHPRHALYKDPADARMWNYTSNELLTKDIPAALAYISLLEGGRKLTLFGHSRGAMFAAWAAQSPLCTRYLELAVPLAGTTLLGEAEAVRPRPRHVRKPPPPILCGACGNASDGSPWPGCCAGAFFLGAPDPIVHPAPGPPEVICRVDTFLPSPFDKLCDEINCIVTGCSDVDAIEKDRIPVLLSFYPSYESVATQTRIDDIDERPNYVAATVPVAVWGGTKDRMISPRAVQRLADALAPSGMVVDHYLADMGHLEEVIGDTCGSVWGARLLSLFDRMDSDQRSATQARASRALHWVD